MSLAVVVAVLGVAVMVVMLLLRAFTCKHAWEFVDKTDFPPPIEAAKNNGVDVDDLYAYQIVEMSQRTSVIVLRCPKCGDTRILRETH